MYRTFAEKLPSVFVIVLLGPVIAMAQERPRILSPSEQAVVLNRTTMERGFDELMEAISSRDGGNYDLVRLSGSLPSGIVESHSVMRMVVYDPRVRKLYQLLAAMPEDEAASKAIKSFEGKLQELTQGNKGIGLADTYGLHASLFLMFEFAPRVEFNRLFREWNQWFNDQVATHSRRIESQDYGWARRFFFEMERRPELLMYLNLVAIDQIRQGHRLDDESSEFAKMVDEAGWRSTMSRSFRVVEIYPFDVDGEAAEPLAEVPLFYGWGSLEAANTNQRIRIMTRAQNLMDPPGPMELVRQRFVEGLVDAIEDAQAALKKLEPEREPRESVTRLEFLGPNLPESMAQRFPSLMPPYKGHMLSDIDRLYNKIPDSEKPNWEEVVEEVREWVREVPESGIEAKGRKVFQWPAGEEGPDGEPDSEPEYRIRLEIINMTILKGKPR